MTHWFADLDPWLRWLLSASAQASVLVVLVAGVQLILGRWLSPSWRYALWGLVVARLLMPIAPASPWSVFNLLAEEPRPVIEPTAIAFEPLPVTAIEPVASLPTPTARTLPIERSESIDWGRVLVWVWAGGAILFAVWVAGSHLQLARRIGRDRCEADTETDGLLDACREQMDLPRHVRIILTDAVTGPALMGVLRPRILIPPYLLTALSRDQLRHVLMHELAHLKRHDIAVNWLLIVLTALHWFNPLIWFAFHRLRSDREPLRDAMVLRRTDTDANRDYGRTIIRVLEELTRPRLGNPALAGITESRRQMRRRIRLIADFGRRPRKWLAAVGVLTLLFLAAIGLTDAAEPEADIEWSETATFTTATDSPTFDQTVIGQIEGREVTADEVLEPLAKQLESLGQTRTPADFERDSRVLIDHRIRQLLTDRLILHEAQSMLTETEQQGLEVMLEKQRAELEQMNLPGGPDAIDKKLEEFRQGVVVSKLLRETLYPQVNVTENDLRRYFRNHPDEFAPLTQRTLRIIRTSDPESIDRINAALTADRPFAELAATPDNQYRTDQAGLFGNVVGDTIFKDPALNQAVTALQVGQTTPDLTVDGEQWWVHVEKLEAFEPQSFDDAREQIERVLTDQQFKKLTETYRAELFARGNYTDPQVMIDKLVGIAGDRYADPVRQEASTIPSIIDAVAAEIRDGKRPVSPTLFPGQNRSVVINADGDTIKSRDPARVDAAILDQATELANRQTQLLLQRTAPRNLFGNFTVDSPWLLHDALRAVEKASDAKFVVKWNQLAGLGIQQWETLTAADYPDAITLDQALVLSLANVQIEGDERPTYAIIDGLVVISTRADLQQNPPHRMDEAGLEEETNRRAAQKLREPIPIDFDKNRLVDAVEYFRNVTGVNFFVNWPEVEATGIEQTTPVSLKLADTPADEALRQVLAQVSAINEFDPLAYSIIEGIVTITTRRQTEMRSVSLRLYDIRDILTVVPDFRFDPDEPVRVDPTHEEQVEQVINLIQETVGRPDDWAAYGSDLSSIREINGQLIIETSADNHRAIVGLLAQLREARAIQVSFESRFVMLPIDFLEKEEQIGLDLTVPADSPLGTPPHGLITDFQTNVLIQAAQGDPRAAVLTALRLTQFDGKQAHVVAQEQIAYAQTIEEAADRESGIDVTTATISEGCLLEARGTVSQDRRYISAELYGVVNNLRKPIPTEVWGKDADGKDLIIEQPEVDTAEARLTLTLPDRATVIVDLGTVRGPLEAVGVEDKVDEDLERRVLMLVKPTIIVPSPDGEKLFSGLLKTPEPVE